jgi:uncharacterized membrane protein YbaN (DUF454 family)
MSTINDHNDTSVNHRLVSSMTLRLVLLILGSVSLALGVLGIFLPVLPTTPFLLLTAACYVRSSTRFYQYLLTHPVLSRYILAYLDGKGLPRQAKRYTLLLMWLTMSITMLIVPLWQVKVFMLITALAVSTYIWRLPEPDSVKNLDSRPDHEEQIQ